VSSCEVFALSNSSCRYHRRTALYQGLPSCTSNMDMQPVAPVIGKGSVNRRGSFYIPAILRRTHQVHRRNIRTDPVVCKHVDPICQSTNKSDCSTHHTLTPRRLRIQLDGLLRTGWPVDCRIALTITGFVSTSEWPRTAVRFRDLKSGLSREEGRFVWSLAMEPNQFTK
jgi:hypothetical protein